jgi:hypothetical protein
MSNRVVVIRTICVHLPDPGIPTFVTTATTIYQTILRALSCASRQKEIYPGIVMVLNHLMVFLRSRSIACDVVGNWCLSFILSSSSFYVVKFLHSSNSMATIRVADGFCVIFLLSWSSLYNSILSRNENACSHFAFRNLPFVLVCSFIIDRVKLWQY